MAAGAARMGGIAAVLGLVVLTLLAAHTHAMIIGIDFGSAFMKVSLVKPGTPFEIVLNNNGRRKSDTKIAFDQGQRLFAGDAKVLASRRPHRVVDSIAPLLGRSVEHPIVKELNQQYIAYFVRPVEQRNTVALQLGDPSSRGTAFVTAEEAAALETETFTAEELAAMLLGYVKDFASVEAGGDIKDCVITVPMFATQAERLAMLDAAQLAGLNVLSLVEENTAAAIQYGIDRVFENHTQHTLIYNMGARNTQVSVLQSTAYNTRSKGRNVTVGTGRIIGKAWDANLGGDTFSFRMQQLLADRFNEEHPDMDIRASPRGMAKLRLNGAKVKEILSANEEFPLYIESLLPDIDFRSKVTRKDLFDTCGDLFERALVPVRSALADAGLEVGDIHEVEIIGGGVRIPQLQTMLKAVFEDRLPLAVHLNGDEAAALGSAFLGANRSTAFRVRKVGMVDTTPFAVGVRLTDLPLPDDAEVDATTDAAAAAAGEESEDEEGGKAKKPWTKRSQLFRQYNHLQSLKKITFPHTADFHVKLQYEKSAPIPEGTGRVLAAYNISGVVEAAAERPHLGKPKVHLSFQLDHNGVASLVKAEATQQEIIQPEPEPEEEAEEGAEKAAQEEGEEAAAAEGDAAEAAAEGETEPAASEKEPAASEKEGEADSEEAGAGEDEGAGEGEGEGDAEKQGDGSTTEEGKEEQEEKKPKQKKKRKPQKPRKVTHRYPLTITEDTTELVVKPMSVSARAGSAKKLSELRRVDEERKAREKARNELEAFIYAKRDAISENEEQLGAVSKPEDLDEIRAQLMDVEDWLYDEGEEASGTEYKAKLRELGDVIDPIEFRAEEAELRPKAFDSARQFATGAVEILDKWATSRPWLNETDVEQVRAEAARLQTWLSEKEEEQAGVEAHTAPIITSKAIKSETKLLARAIKRLERIPKPPPPPPPPKAEEAEGAEDKAANTSDEEAATEAEAEAAPAEGGEATDADAAEPEAEGEATGDEAAEEQEEEEEEGDAGEPEL